MSTVEMFEFRQQQVRTVLIDGEPWFVAVDVCKVLGLSNSTVVVSRLDPDERSKFKLGRQGDGLIVNESGLYTLILGSRKPEARLFRKWVTSEVLPQIRRTGVYQANQFAIPATFAEALELAASKVRELEAAQAKIAADAPKVEYVDTFVADSDLRLLRDVAKDLGVTEQTLRGMLLAKGWIYVQVDERWSERERRKVRRYRYSAYAHKAKYFQHVPNHEVPRFRGEVFHTLKVTPAGGVGVARLLRGVGDGLDGLDVALAVDA